MIIYRGLGGFAIGVFGLIFFGLVIGFDSAFGTHSLSGRPLWVPLAANLCAGALTWALGRRLNRAPLEVTVYEETGPRTTFEPRHTLYFVRMEYWGPIFSTLVLAAFLTAWLKR